MKDHKQRILVLTPYPLGVAPSQRLRVEGLMHLLDPTRFSVVISCFLDTNTWEILYSSNRKFGKLRGVFNGFWRRAKIVFLKAKNFDQIFIHREAAPIGPPIFEWYLKSVLQKKIIYDFDDAIWIPNTSTENKIALWLKCTWKVKLICKWADTISVGNEYLLQYAKRYSRGTSLIMPTVVDTEFKYLPKKFNNKTETLTLGWTGTHSTLKYLYMIVPVIQKLQRRYDFRVLVIADKNPNLPLLNYTYIKWREETEMEDLRKIDIGLMPLESDSWSDGKCGFKIIQYMAIGIASIASKVGVNTIIIDDGVNGLLCKSSEEWSEKLESLLVEAELRYVLGKNGRQRIRENYSVNAQEKTFLSLFNEDIIV